MSLIVKFVHGANRPDDEESQPFSIYTDVTSAHFPPKDSGIARLQVREPVKTALVPGFVENEVNVEITGPVYVMNESGRTIAVHRPRPKVAATEAPDQLAKLAAHRVATLGESEFKHYDGYEPLNIQAEAPA